MLDHPVHVRKTYARLAMSILSDLNKAKTYESLKRTISKKRPNWSFDQTPAGKFVFYVDGNYVNAYWTLDGLKRGLLAVDGQHGT